MTAKAVALGAELKYTRRGGCITPTATPEPNSVNVTIGLFSIIKLFRIVQLSVQSKGICIPVECEETTPFNPCDFFDNLDFPMDIFSPPYKDDFIAGVSANIPREGRNGERPCGCDGEIE